MYTIQEKTAQISILTLGDCVVSSGGRTVAPTFNFLRILVYILLETRGRPVLRRRIASLIWSDTPSDQANADIRQTIARIRRFQEEENFQLLSTDSQTAWLNLDQNVYIDLAEFIDLIANPSPSAWVRLCQIYKGDLLGSQRPAGEGFEEWLDHHRTALRYDFVSAISQAVLPDSQLTPQERHFCAQRLLQEDPYHEGAHRALMYDAALNGQFSFVRYLFEECSRTLRDELGIKPAEETTRLYRRLINGEPVS